ncbi:MAG: hypothetical protein QW395_05505 [Candidatus Nitrosotenuis sp.]
MSGNVLVWIDNGFLLFGVAKFLQTQNYDLYAILDTNESIAKFFQNQKLVKFNKTWYFYDHITNSQQDLQYLQQIEEKYNIKLWSIAYTDRLFYNKYNTYHHFTSDEILSILSSSSRFFEKIIEEIKPSCILMTAATQHYQYLLCKICENKKIPVFTLEPLRFGNRNMIVNGTIYDSIDITSSTNVKQRTTQEIHDFLKSNKPGQFYLVEKAHKNYRISKLDKLKAMVQFVLPNKSRNPSQYKHSGRSKLNVMLKGTARIHLLKKKYRKSFINKFSTKIDTSLPFVYFPLHFEPERVLLMGAPFYTDQISVITNIAKSLPIGYKLLVKEHPVMETQGWRPVSFYKQIMDLPNVQLIHPSISSEEIIKKSSLVITIRGTTSLEATFFGKPSIVLKPDIGYNTIQSITILENIEKLPDAIKSTLNKNADPSELNSYIDFLEKDSFEFPNEKYYYEVANRFKFNVGYLKEIEIKEKDMKEFLNDLNSTFEMLSQKYLEKIKKYAVWS